VIRAAGVVIVLRSGHGIVAIAMCEFAAALVGNLMLMWLARRVYPELRLRLGKPKPGILRSLWTYSFYAFLTTIAVQLVYQTDNLVVGTFISAAAVTFYSIGNTLCRYTDQFAGVMTMTFVPAASTYEASGHTEGLRSLYYTGTRATLGLALPILITLIIRGHTFIGLWMGPDYAHLAGNILIILAFPIMFSYANRTAVSIAFGIEKHKKSAIWAIGEGVANLALSIALVHWFGIYGVAVGTMIPSLFVQLFLWPRFVHELVGVKASDVYLRVWAPMFLAAVPFAIVSYAVNEYFPTRSVLIFMLQSAAMLPVFVGVIALIYRRSFGTQIMPRIRSFMLARRAT
jgi:O-antigen/teichoic acid export membrane protein